MMQYELWNTRNGIVVATWSSEAKAAEQIREQPGLASEPVELLLHRDDGTTEKLADQESLHAWASARSEGAAPSMQKVVDGPHDPRVLLRNAIAESRAATAGLTGESPPANTAGTEAWRPFRSSPPERTSSVRRVVARG
jgi:hypothetical protein